MKVKRNIFQISHRMRVCGSGGCFFIILLFFVFSCKISTNDDIYIKYPEGTTLTVEILKDAKQIIKYKSEIILVVNISNEWNGFANHLLFFNSDRKLYAATYFSSEIIRDINNNIINCVFYEARGKRSKYYTKDLPQKFKFNYINANIGKNTRISNKLINQMSYNRITNEVKLFVSKTEDSSKGLRWNITVGDNSFFSNYNLKDTLNIPIERLFIDYKNMILYYEYDNNDILVRDKMIVSNENLFDTLFSDILVR